MIAHRWQRGNARCAQSGLSGFEQRLPLLRYPQRQHTNPIGWWNCVADMSMPLCLWIRGLVAVSGCLTRKLAKEGRGLAPGCNRVSAVEKT